MNILNFKNTKKVTFILRLKLCLKYVCMRRLEGVRAEIFFPLEFPLVSLYFNKAVLQEEKKKMSPRLDKFSSCFGITRGECMPELPLQL